MKKIKMLVFDVDGTLYDLKHHEIPASAIAAIQQAKQNGYLFVIASGRAHYGLGAKLMELQPDYIISVSGGVVVDQHQSIITRHDFTKQDVEDLLQFCHTQEAGLILKFIDHMYIYQHPEKIDWLEGQRKSDIGEAPFLSHPQQNHHVLDLPQSASVHADPLIVQQVYGAHPTLQFLPYSEDGFDVVLRGIHKGLGVQALMDHLRLDKEEVACFGDNYNDLEMMQVVGHPIAMGNAVEDIKKVAEFITATSDQDGIYIGLQYLHCI